MLIDILSNKKVCQHSSQMPNDDNNTQSRHRKTTIMSEEDVSSGKKSKWEALEICGSVKYLSEKLWDYKHLQRLYLSNNQLTRIPAEITCLINLYVLDLSSNKLRSLPAEIGYMIKLRELYLNNNILRVLPYEIGRLFNLQILGLSGNPLQQDVISMSKSGTQRLLAYFLDNLVMTTPEPPDRQWVQIGYYHQTHSPAQFSVMTYNVLCDKYATRNLYGYCPPWALQWDYRRKRIMNDIGYYGSDILALQEVETREYQNFFLPELKRLGYAGMFSPKSRAKHMGEEDKKHVDGCAIFWRTSKFTLIREHLIEFNQVAMQNNEGSQEMLNRVMTKDNIGIAALLETTDALYTENANYTPNCYPERQQILAVNAHMHWDPDFSDVKLIQTVMLCFELKRICDEAGRNITPAAAPTATTGGGRSSTGINDFQKIPIVMCGDFNSLPDSGVVEFLQTGKVSATHKDFRDFPYSKCLNAFGNGLRSNGNLQMDAKYVTHPFKFNSSYSNEYLEKLKYTNITHDFRGIIDYIFYSRSQLNCLGILLGMDMDWFKQHNIVGCPHPYVPSDHIALVTEFQLLPQGFQPPPPNNTGNAFTPNHQQQQQSQHSSYPPQFSGRFFGGPPQQSPSNYPISALPPNGVHQQQQNQGVSNTRYQNNTNTGGSRPGSANIHNHSPINIPNGANMSHQQHMSGMGLNLNARR